MFTDSDPVMVDWLADVLRQEWLAMDRRHRLLLQTLGPYLSKTVIPDACALATLLQAAEQIEIDFADTGDSQAREFSCDQPLKSQHAKGAVRTEAEEPVVFQDMEHDFAETCGGQTRVQAQMQVVDDNCAGGASAKDVQAETFSELAVASCINGVHAECECEDTTQNQDMHMESESQVTEDVSPTATANYSSFTRGTQGTQGTRTRRNKLSFLFHKVASGTVPWWHPSSLARSKGFEVFFAALIVLNCVTMVIEVQYQGLLLGYNIGYPKFDSSGESRWPWAAGAFQVFEMLFGVLFTIEVIIKILGLRCKFLFSPWSWFDSALVIFWVISLLDVALPINSSLLRLVRLARLLRLVRLARAFQGFDSLIVMVTAIRGSVQALFWVLFLLLIAQTMFALIINQLLGYYIEDDTIPLEDRQTIFKYFGNFSRALLTMFELVLGNWVPVARLLHEKVTPLFMIFSISHKVTFGFAVLGVINGVFMQETIKVTLSDDTIMIRETKKKQLKHKKKMDDFFHLSDADGSGDISIDEWHRVIGHETVKHWFGGMGLSIKDSEMLFAMLKEESAGLLTTEELSDGVDRLQGPARSLDVHVLMHEQRKLRALLQEVLQMHITIPPV